MKVKFNKKGEYLVCINDTYIKGIIWKMVEGAKPEWDGRDIAVSNTWRQKQIMAEIKSHYMK